MHFLLKLKLHLNLLSWRKSFYGRIKNMKINLPKNIFHNLLSSLYVLTNWENYCNLSCNQILLRMDYSIFPNFRIGKIYILHMCNHSFYSKFILKYQSNIKWYLNINELILQYSSWFNSLFNTMFYKKNSRLKIQFSFQTRLEMRKISLKRFQH